MEKINSINVNGTVAQIEDSEAIHKGGLKTLNGINLEGEGNIEIGSTGTSFIEIHYRDLYTLYSQSKLVPGTMYAITDYKCAYKHPATGSDEAFEMEVAAPDVKYIIVQATSTSTLDERVQYIRKEGYRKILECRYTIDPEIIGFTKGMTTYQPTGAVYYMRDEADNECDYDFKHVKFRRYAITDITANTRGDNGTGGIAGPFRAFMEKTGTSYVWSDDRQRIGAGCESEKELIQDIFNGTWSGKNEWTSSIEMSTLKALHSDYTLNMIKPYQITSRPYDKYLAWQTNMYESGGISAKWSAGTCQVEGMSNVTVSSSDYIDRYTFDIKGEDASDMFTFESTTKHMIAGCSVMQITNRDNMMDESLPNTVISISEGAIEIASTCISGLKIGGRILTGGNTILLYPGFNNGNFAQSFNVNLSGNPLAPFRGNLIISNYFHNCNLNGLSNSFLCGAFNNFTVHWGLQNSVLLGKYSGVEIGNWSRILMYGFNSIIKYADEDSVKSAPDGTYTYALRTLDNVYASIIGPLQYVSIEPHFNSNTLRAPYNKGLTFYGNIQYNSFGFLRWGTTFHYGACGGFKFNEMIRTTFTSACFPNQGYSKNASGAKYVNEETNEVQGLNSVEILSDTADPLLIATTLPEAAKNAIKNYNWGMPKYKLVWDNTHSTWHLFNHLGTEITD